MDSYITVHGEATYEITEKKSRFIARVSMADTEEAALAFISRIKSENRDARHNCFAYITELGRKARFSDDGEPQGSAGAPIMEAIKKSGLTDTVITVTRYFGGILLGAGGLVRAYGKAASLALSCAEKDIYTEKVFFSARMNYEELNKYTYLIKKAGAVETGKNYGESVEITAFIPEGKYSALEEEIINNFAGKLRPELKEKKYTAQ